MAKVSVIVPVYNVMDYLNESMRSILRQTLKDLEIICVNDGSTDASSEILRRYAAEDDRIVIIDQENGGYGKAMNAGLDRATGEYIGIVEPDDYIPLEMYEDLYEVVKEYDLDFVKADFYRFTRDSEGSMLVLYNHLSRTPEDYNRLFDPSHTPEALRYRMNIWTGIYRRSFIEKHHIRLHETPGASYQDNGFWGQTFAFATRAMILDKPYYRYRADRTEASTNNRGKVYAVDGELEYIRQKIEQDPVLWERFKGQYWVRRYRCMVDVAARIAPELRHEYISHNHQVFRTAMENGEIDYSLYTPRFSEEVSLLIQDPEQYELTRKFKTRVFLNPEEMDGKMKELQKEKSAQKARISELKHRNEELKHRNEELKKKNRELSEGNKKLKQSIDYRLGNGLLKLPRKLKSVVRG